MSVILFTNNSQYIRLLGLKDVKTGSYINDATVTATLYDSTGAVVTGINNLSMASISSTGDYEAEVPATFAPDTNQKYTLRCIAINASGKRYDITRDVRVATRAQ